MRLFTSSPAVWRTVPVAVRQALERTRGRTGITSTVTNDRLKNCYGLVIAIGMGKGQSELATVYPAGVQSFQTLWFVPPGE